MLQHSVVRSIAKRPVVLAIPRAVWVARYLSSCPEEATEEPAWNAFDVLGVPERFSIDETQLKNNYRKLMGEYHPDRFQQASAVDQDSMQEKSSAVTQAYQELLSPHTRAAHIMALRGKPMTETLSQQVVGMDFLMEIMEIREVVDNVADGSDQELHKLLAENEHRLDATCEELEKALKHGDLDDALKHTARLQYWNRVIETIREKMENVA